MAKVPEGVILHHPTGKVGRITSPYGYRFSPITGKKEFHPGIDIGLPQGSKLYAIADGVVFRTDYNDRRGFGGQIIVHHPSLGVYAQYGHVSEFKVGPNARVKAGELLGLSGGAKGTTGAGASTGAHLHFEIRDTPNAHSTYQYTYPDGHYHNDPAVFLGL